MGSFLLAVSAQADWGVAEDSRVSYVSIKNDIIAENNYFDRVTGSITNEGDVSIRIDLASVQTRVDIRNQRMRDLFFEVAKHPEALISAELSPRDMEILATGAPVERELPLSVSIHGARNDVTAKLRAIATGGHLYVTTLEPILISAADFGREPGVNALQEIAGLKSIARAIPVTVNLHLVRDLPASFFSVSPRSAAERRVVSDNGGRSAYPPALCCSQLALRALPDFQAVRC